jgi:L-ascorbate metabolism protein UlaG (beta-lactamase superfamily)
VVKLAKQQPDTLFLVPLGLESLLKSWGVENVKEMDWWETHTIGENQITFVPAYHWSARTLTDRNKSLWGGWTMKNPKLNFYFSGDTGYSKDFEEIGKRLGPFDFSAIAVGAYEPRWFMKAQHINPDEAVQIHKDVRSSKSMGIHWGTFELTDEPLDQPIGDLKLALEKHSVQPSDFELLGHGDTINLR